MENRGTSARNPDSGFKPLVCDEDLHSVEHPPKPYFYQSRLQVFTDIMTPRSRCRPAAVSLALLAVVLLIIDISLGVHLKKTLKDTHLTLKHIANELTELQHTYKTANKSMNDYKKQLDSEMSRQTGTNREFEHPRNRSTDFEALVVKVANDIEELRNSLSMISTEKGCKHCPPGWILLNSVCYFFSLPNHAGYNTWQEAREFCQTRGGDLAVIDSKDKENSIVHYLRTSQVDINANKGFWIGLNDYEEKGTWKWLDGRTMIDGYWMDGEPNNLDEEICVGVYPKTDFLKAWNDVRCDAMINWICEKAPASFS